MEGFKPKYVVLSLRLTLKRLEAAFKLNQTSYLSWLFALLLRFLTQDKSITYVHVSDSRPSETTWDDSLRYQWNLRAKPGQQAPLGTVDEPIPWDDLDIQDKVCSLLESHSVAFVFA